MPPGPPPGVPPQGMQQQQHQGGIRPLMPKPLGVLSAKPQVSGYYPSVSFSDFLSRYVYMYRKIHVLRACLCYDVDGPIEIYSVLAVTTFWQSFASRMDVGRYT